MFPTSLLTPLGLVGAFSGTNLSRVENQAAKAVSLLATTAYEARREHRAFLTSDRR